MPDETRRCPKCGAFAAVVRTYPEATFLECGSCKHSEVLSMALDFRSD
ncbi:MAG: hypothetical protein ACT4PT_12865 [Methanobacteriota archaeon]